MSKNINFSDEKCRDDGSFEQDMIGGEYVFTQST